MRVVIVEDPRRTAQTLLDRGEISVGELWLRYWANGGDAQPFEFEAYIHEMYELRAIDQEVLALAMEDLETSRKPRWWYY